MKPHWITVPHAAAQADVSTSTIRRWAREGVIPSTRAASGTLRVDANALTKDALFQRKVDKILAGII